MLGMGFREEVVPIAEMTKASRRATWLFFGDVSGEDPAPDHGLDVGAA